jgi:tetratricopeptide (TPR) repeat protein
LKTITQVDHETAQLFQKAMALYQQGHLADAKLIYESVLRKTPRNLDALNFLGVIALQFGDFQIAIKIINEVVDNSLQSLDSNHESIPNNQEQYNEFINSLDSKSTDNDDIQYIFNPMNFTSNNISSKINDSNNNSNDHRYNICIIRKSNNSYNYYQEEIVYSYFIIYLSPSRIKNLVEVITMRDIMNKVTSKNMLCHLLNN